MKLTVLGSGSATPTLHRNPTAQLLEAAGRFYLIDCGEGAQMALLRTQTSVQKIDAIFISHLHGDHWLGLPGLLSSMNLGGRNRLLKLFCPSELQSVLNIIFAASQTVLNFQLSYHFHTENNLAMIEETDKLEVYAFPLRHRIVCNGFLFKEKIRPRNIRKDAITIHKIPTQDIESIKAGKDWLSPEGILYPNKLLTRDPKPSSSYAYCSDTIFYPTMCNHLKKVSVLYHEATFEDKLIERAKKTFHSTASQAAEIARNSEVEKLLIGHFSSRYVSAEKHLTEARSIFKNTIEVFDGFKIEF